METVSSNGANVGNPVDVAHRSRLRNLASEYHEPMRPRGIPSSGFSELPKIKNLVS